MQNKYLPLGTSKIVKKSLLLVLLLLVNAFFGVSNLKAQTTVYLDDFSTNTSTTYTTSGLIGASDWSVQRSGDDWGARRNVTLLEQLELTNNASGNANVDGWIFANIATSSFASPYNTALNLNPGIITWTFNMRQIRTNPSGFASGNYGIAFILAGSSVTVNNSGNGYAIVLGQTGTTDPIRLVNYTTGFSGTITNLITSNTAGLTDFGNEYLSIQVTYDPSNEQWELFLRNDATAFVDPATGTLISQGTVTDATYTGTSLAYSGAYWQGSTLADQTSFFDNYKVTVDPLAVEPTNAVANPNASKSNPFDLLSTPTAKLDVTITWDDNNVGGVDADGFLIWISESDAPPELIDGTGTDNNTDLTSSTSGAKNIPPGEGTYTWDNLKPITPGDVGQQYYYWIYPYTGSGSNINYKTPASDNTPVTNDQAPNDDSFVIEPSTQVTGGIDISSNDTLAGDAVPVFRFTIKDEPTASDSYSTLVTKVRVTPYRTNTADWSDHIKGVVLTDDSDASTFIPDSVIITDAYIDIYLAAGDLVVESETSKDYTLSVYLNNNNIVDNTILSFYIEGSDQGFTSSKYGSQFLIDPFGADFNSGDFNIVVAAAKLVFQAVPSVININTEFTVTVWATDDNGNLDEDDNTTSISLTSAGTLGNIFTTSSSLTQTLVGGIYTWTDIKYDIDENFTITATDNGALLDPITSETITAYTSGYAIPGSIIISEIMIDPNAVGDANGEWIELYNNNTVDIALTNWTLTDAGGESYTIPAITILAGDFLVLGIDNAPGTNGNLTVDQLYTGFTLDDAADQIILTNNSAVEIDKVEYDNTAGWTIPSGSSIIFTGTINDDNNDVSLWTASTVREKGYLDASAGDFGSPGTNGFQQDLITSSTYTNTGSWSTGNQYGINNWDNGVPGPSAIVTIDGDVIVDVDTPAACNNLTILTGRSLTISPLKALTIYGDLITNDGLILEANVNGNSSLITYGDVTGNAEVQSYFDGLDLYYLVSSPIEDGLGGIFTGDVVYYYDEPNYMWQNPTLITYHLGVGIGYAIYKKYTNSVSYIGSLNTGDVPNTLDFTDRSNSTPIDGWNLMGNPYPSVLDISYLDYANISNGVWVNLHDPASTDTDINQDRYVYWSKTLGTVGSSGEGGGDLRARYIQPGQGFWIYTDVNGTAFNLNNSMRTHYKLGVFSKAATVDNTPSLDQILKISISGNGFTDPSYILFKSNAGLNFDREYDLLKMTSSAASVPHIFSITEEENPQWLAINAISAPQSETHIPLGLKIGSDGVYRLNFEGLNSFENTQDFYLKDNLTGDLFDIRQNATVEFTHSTSNAANRFDLVIGLQTDINNPIGISNLVEVFSAQNRLYIRPGDNQIIKNINIVNLLGQSVYRNSYSSRFNTGVELNIPTAFYLVEIETETESITKKVFIQNQN